MSLKENLTSKLSLRDLLNSNNFHTYNRKLAISIGLEAAIFLSELIDKYEYYEKKDALMEIDGEEGWFYMTMEAVLERTGLSRDGQNTAIKKLTALGLLKVTLKGLPAKRHFRIIQENFTSLLETTYLGATNKYVESNKLDRCFQQTEALRAYTDKKNPMKRPSVCSEAPPASQAPPVSGDCPPSRAVVVDFDGKESELTLEGLFQISVLKRMNWTSEEIAECWKVIASYKKPIRDVAHFADATIKKQRKIKYAERDAEEKKGKKWNTMKASNDSKKIVRTWQISSSEKNADSDTLARIIDL